MLDSEIDRLAHHAALCGDLNAACAEIQSKIGQSSGDIAAAFFSGWAEADYAGASMDDRARGLADYIRTEMMFSKAQ